jgi:hypothetical protein
LFTFKISSYLYKRAVQRGVQEREKKLKTQRTENYFPQERRMKNKIKNFIITDIFTLRDKLW